METLYHDSDRYTRGLIRVFAVCYTLSMGRQEIVTDDLDGSTPAQQYGWELDGRSYRVDLTQSNADQLFEVLDIVGRYVAVSKRVRVRKPVEAQAEAPKA
jgi:hypothetical protein